MMNKKARPLLQIAVISLFPEMFEALNVGICGRAIKNELVSITVFNPRDYATDTYKTVDDRPYGGGPGMVMLFEPLQAAIKAARHALGDTAKVIYLSPQGKPLNHAGVKQLSDSGPLIFIAGRYEGIDERIIETYVDEQWSLGDFVLSGGEIAALAFIDAMVRLQEGALGHAQSAEQDSFCNDLLDCPHYTRPEHIDGQAVPKVLLSGNHAAIERWRLQQSLLRTKLLRPDLLAKRGLTENEQLLLDEFTKEHIK